MKKEYITRNELRNGLLLIILGTVLFIGAVYWGGSLEEIKELSCDEYCYNNLSNSCSWDCPNNVTFIYWINSAFCMLVGVIGWILIIFAFREVFSSKKGARG